MTKKIKYRLPWDDFVPYAPDTPGTIHIHHCKQGPNNDRLYITRRVDDVILAYCHHCGCSGVYSVLGSRTLSSRKKAESSDELSGAANTRAVEYAKHIQRSANQEGTGRRGQTAGRKLYNHTRRSQSTRPASDFGTWETLAKRWWLECGLTIEDAELYGVSYDPHNREVVLPVFYEGKRVGEVSKTFRPDAPKYITSGESIHQIIPHVGSGSHDELLIVEDLRSAYKCAKVIDTLPLLGTKLTDEQLADIVRAKYSKVYIFLDNDNIEIKRLARTLYRLLTPHVRCEIIKHTACDPKMLSASQLKELLK